MFGPPTTAGRRSDAGQQPFVRASQRPVSDIRFRELVARKRSVVHAPKPPKVAQERRAHIGGQNSGRLRRGARLETVGAHRFGSLACMSSAGQPQRAPDGAPVHYEPSCAVRDWLNWRITWSRNRLDNSSPASTSATARAASVAASSQKRSERVQWRPAPCFKAASPSGSPCHGPSRWCLGTAKAAGGPRRRPCICSTRSFCAWPFARGFCRCPLRCACCWLRSPSW